jgi:hypothetical protein
MKMEVTCSSETSVDFQWNTRNDIPEDITLRILKSVWGMDWIYLVQLVSSVEKLIDHQLAKKNSAPGVPLFDYVLKFKIMNLTVANDKCGRGAASLKILVLFCTEIQFPADQLFLRFDVMFAQDISPSASDEDMTEPPGPCVYVGP